MSAEVRRIPVDIQQKHPSLYTHQIDTIRQQMDQNPEAVARTIVAGLVTIGRLRGQIYDDNIVRRRLQQETAEDHLTGLKNRKWFESELKEKIAQAERNKSPLWLLFMDIDDFKRTNTQYGHPMGDKILQQISHLSREGEPIARLGGEEFGQLFMGELPPVAIAAINERYQKRMEQLSSEVLTSSTPLHEYAPEELLRQNSLSIGIARHREGEEGKALYNRANKAMHEAKKRGKMQLIVANSCNEELIFSQPSVQV